MTTIEHQLVHMQPDNSRITSARNITTGPFAMASKPGWPESYLVFANAGTNPTVNIDSAGFTVRRLDTITGIEDNDPIGLTVAGNNVLTGTGNDTAWWISGEVEPIYNSGIHTSIYYENFESYADIDEFYGATGDYDYSWNGTRSTQGQREAIMLTGGVDGEKNIRLDYTDEAHDANGWPTSTAYSMNYWPTGIDWATPTTSADVLLISYYVKNTGPFHWKKRFEFHCDAPGDTRRFMMHNNARVEPKDLEECWWGENWPYDPLPSSDAPPVRTGLAIDLNSSEAIFAARQGNAATYSANVNYSEWSDWADNDGDWHRYTIRITREGALDGTGRVEVWRDGVKTMQFIGDDNTNYPCSYGQVWTVKPGYAMLRTTSQMIFGQTTSGGGDWAGGVYLYYDAVRVYVPKSGRDIEPLYNPSIHTSLFHDDITSYDSIEGAGVNMESGAGDNRWTYTPQVGTVISGVSKTGGPTGGGYFYNTYLQTDANGSFLVHADNPVDGNADPNPLIYTFWIKNTNNKYRAKIAYGDYDQGSSPNVGSRRMVHAWSQISNEPEELQDCYWAIPYPYPPHDSVNTPGIGGPSGYVHLTINYDGQAAGADRAGDGWTPTVLNFWYNPNWGNADLVDWNEWGDGVWHRVTVRVTKSTGAYGGVNYDGRLEMWYDGVKIHDWIGDDPTRDEYQTVYTPGTSQRILSAFGFEGPSAPSGIGGTFPQTVQYGDIRFFTEI